jgi:hypothetical protein
MERRAVCAESAVEAGADPLSVARGFLVPELARLVDYTVVGYHCTLGEVTDDDPAARTMIHHLLLEATQKRWSYDVLPVHHDPDEEDRIGAVLEDLPAGSICGFSPVDPPFWVVITKRAVWG